MNALQIWTIGDRSTGSTRLRIHQYLPRLAADGLAVRVRTIPRGFFPRLLLKSSLHRGDRLLVQKKLFAPAELARLRDRAGTLLYDVDDAVYLDGPGSARNRERWEAVTEAADRVLAGNRTLAGASVRPERARVVPTPVDTERHRPSQFGEREPGLLVWIGSRAGLASLAPVLGAFPRARARAPRARLAICADRPPAALPDGASFVRWSLKAESELLARAWAGLMPLDDTPFNRGKCGFKILLYRAAGLAVAASPVGVNAELVAPGEDGFLPAGPEAWEEAMARLAADPDTARRFGEAGRERVVATHSVAAVYPAFRDAVTEGR